MAKRNKLIITISAIATFIVAFLLCTFYDFQISEAISRLTDGKYYSENLYGIFFEIIGETPSYIIGVFAGCNIIRKIWQMQNKKLKIALVVILSCLATFAYAMMLKRMCGYIFENIGASERYEKLNTLILFGGLVLGGGLFALTYYLTCKIPEKYLNGLVVFSIGALIAVAFSQGVAHGVKSLVGRQRFRTIKVLEYHGLNSLIDYSEWFVIHGKRVVSAEMLALGIAKDGYKSFPSGHTCAWGMLFALTVLPDFLNLDEKKRVKIKGVLIVSTVIAVLLVAYARVLVGAHYATDTLFAGALTYFSVVMGKFIAKKIGKALKL